MDEHEIQTMEHIQQGLDHLALVDQKLKAIIELVGEVPLRRREGGFSALVGMITSQQISVAAASSIFNKMQEKGLTDRENVRKAVNSQLRSCGLSPQKIRYIKSLAEAEVDFDTLHQQSNSEIIQQLTKVKGIGLWTAEIYLMFSVGRRDVFAAGDLALQVAVKELFNLEKRPSENELRKIAEEWSPWRGVAARLLWAYYREIKKREGIR